MSSLPTLYWPAGMLGPPPNAPAPREANNSVENKLKEIVDFWKFKKQHWFPPSEFVKSFQHLFDALVHVRDLRLNSDVALERLFPGGAVQYIFGTTSDVERPGEQINIAWCRWSGRSGMISGSGFSKEQAKKSAAYEALRTILGNQFADYNIISASLNYVGINAEELRLALWAQGLHTENDDLLGSHNIATELAAVALGSNSSDQREAAAVFNENTLSIISGLFPSELNGDILDPNILKWDAKSWKTLSKTEKEEILFQFWVKTSSKKFPLTMNLVLTRYPFSNCALGAFMLLFSEGMKIHKAGVQWKTLDKEGASFKVELVWYHPVSKVYHHHVGTGEKLDHARADAAKQALRTVYTQKDLQILEYASQGFFFDENTVPSIPISREALHKRLKEAKKDGVVFSNPVRVPSSNSGGPGSGVNSYASNQTARPNNLPSAALQLAPRIPMHVVPSRNDIPASSCTTAGSPAQQVQNSTTNFVHQGLFNTTAEVPQYPVTAQQDPAPPLSQEASSVPVEAQSPVQPSESVLDINGNNVQADEDPFAEYFSDSPDGLISVPDWLTQKYFQPQVSQDSVEWLDFSSDDDPSQQQTLVANTPFLPFDKIIGYNYPEEAAVALDLLFEERRNESESGPKYETCKYVLAECEIGSQTFRAFGSTMEEAQERAAQLALEALQDSSN